MGGGEKENNVQQPDMSKMKICGTCGKPIAKSAKACPYCGAKQKKPVYKKPVFWILVVVIVLAAAGSAGSGSKKQSVTVDPSAAVGETQAGAAADTGAEESAVGEAFADTAIAMNTPVEVDDGLTLTVLSAGGYDSGNQFLQPEAGKMYYRVEIELANNSSADMTVSSMLSFSAYADDYSIDPAIVNQDTLDGTVAAGKKIRGSLVYEIPTDCKTLQVDYKSNVWTGKTFTMTFQIQ